MHRDGDDALTLVVAPADGGAVAAALDRYHFSEDLEVLGPEEAWALTVAGMPAPAGPSVPGVLSSARAVEVVVDDPAAAGDRPPGAPRLRPRRSRWRASPPASPGWA